MQIDINTLAPWVAIAVTLILSILVPVFSQIANNRFQLKKARQDRSLDEEQEKISKKTEAYEGFLMDVGAAVEYQRNDNLSVAGASIGRLYLYVPEECIINWTNYSAAFGNMNGKKPRNSLLHCLKCWLRNTEN